MTIDELKEKVRLAEEKCAKIEKTIERHKSQGEKKVMAQMVIVLILNIMRNVTMILRN